MPLRGPRGAQRGHVPVMEGIGAHWTPQHGAERAEVEGPNRSCLELSCVVLRTVVVFVIEHVAAKRKTTHVCVRFASGREFTALRAGARPDRRHLVASGRGAIGGVWGPSTGRMDGPTDGWMDGRSDGWTDGWTDGWMDGGMDRWTDGWMSHRGPLGIL